jgi:hypothetical protein
MDKTEHHLFYKMSPASNNNYLAVPLQGLANYI